MHIHYVFCLLCFCVRVRVHARNVAEYPQTTPLQTMQMRLHNATITGSMQPIIPKKKKRNTLNPNTHTPKPNTNACTARTAKNMPPNMKTGVRERHPPASPHKHMDNIQTTCAHVCACACICARVRACT